MFSHRRSWWQRVGDPKRNEVSGYRKLHINRLASRNTSHDVSGHSPATSAAQNTSCQIRVKDRHVPFFVLRNTSLGDMKYCHALAQTLVVHIQLHRHEKSILCLQTFIS
ncbi:hypothetical protein AVEN_127091-1 [Araneus ventricosus]|uniref:Uncharacterized protein n=1 Tax=Araneus ventricosus TaxID=182803 RepID=A0A4Y2GXA9_ARAVE|nr:hypothetical protein AVEN_127091-1 [Araneus ventricosus]